MQSPTHEAVASFQDDGYGLFWLYPTVLPHNGGNRVLRFRIFQKMLDDGAPFRADIRFELTPEQANEFADELKAWCAKPTDVFIWKGD